MKLQMNLAAVPDKVPVVAAGEYDATIEKIEAQDAVGERKAQISMQFKIASDGPEKGKGIFDGFPQEFLVDPNSQTSVKLGHLIKSSGQSFTPGPDGSTEIDFDQLLNKTVKLVVIHKNYIDKSTQEAKTAANIKDYLYTK